MIVYLSGPMTGYPGMNRQAFADAAARLRLAGHAVHNPHEANASIPDADRRARLAADLSWICLHAEAVILLPGWDISSGVAAEVAAAEALPVLCYELEFFLAGGF
jgi:Domain of unknown function (DUF4406)